MNVDLNVKTPSGKRVPVYGICFFDASGNDEPLAIIPTKVFDKKDLIYLMHIITKNNPSIQLDSLSQDLSVGNFGTIAKIGLTNVLTWFIRLMVISLLLRVFIALLFRRSL